MLPCFALDKSERKNDLHIKRLPGLLINLLSSPSTPGCCSSRSCVLTLNQHAKHSFFILHSAFNVCSYLWKGEQDEGSEGMARAVKDERNPGLVPSRLQLLSLLLLWFRSSFVRDATPVQRTAAAYYHLCPRPRAVPLRPSSRSPRHNIQIGLHVHELWLPANVALFFPNQVKPVDHQGIHQKVPVTLCKTGQCQRR